MTEAEFKALRNLPGKRIAGDIIFGKSKNTGSLLVFDGITVDNDIGYKVVLNGRYHPGVPFVGFNFVLKGFGPICRVEINADIHREAGRTHKHELKDDGLTFCYEAMDFIGLDDNPCGAWKALCRLANIMHDGEMIV